MSARRHWLSESIIRELPRMLPRLSDEALRLINEIALEDLGATTEATMRGQVYTNLNVATDINSNER